jgi:hypothetical protein
MAGLSGWPVAHPHRRCRSQGVYVGVRGLNVEVGGGEGEEGPDANVWLKAVNGELGESRHGKAGVVGPDE